MLRPHDTTRPEEFLLRDGRAMLIRRIVPADAPRLLAFARRLSPRSLRLRFFTTIPLRRLESANAAAFVRNLANVDFVSHAAFVACFPGSSELHAVGEYIREGELTAELAFVVADDLQGMGLGSELLQHLATFARASGIEHFRAVVLLENRDMLDVFRGSGFPLRIVVQGDTECVLLDIRQPPLSRDFEAGAG